MTDFTYNGQPLNKAYEVVVDNMINDSFFVTFNHPLDDKGIYKIIEKDKIVKVHTPDGMQPFRIMDRVKYMDHVSIEAWPLFYADMRNKLIRPLTIRGLSGQAAMNMFVNNLLIDTPFTFTSNITDMHDYHTQDAEERENNPNQLYNALDVFKDIVKRWQGELVINGYDVRVVNRLGKNTGALLYEKKNISDFTDEESIQDITTRLYGKSEWTERPEGTDEEVKHEISVKVESPLINAYSGIVFEKQYTNNDIRTEKEMKDWLNLKFTTDNIDKPSRNIKVGTNIVDDTVINMGDSLVLKYVKHDVDMEIRMVGYTYDGYANRYITIQLGDAKQSYVGNVQNTVRELETNVSTSVKQTVNQILNANGERMIYSVTEPVGNFKNGDVWYDQQGGMYFWDEESGMWIDHPYNRNMRVMEDEVNTAIETAESAKALAVSEAEQALINANKYADDQDALITQQVNTSVSTAISTAEEAKQAAETSYTNAVAEAERLAGEQSTAFNKKFEENALSMNTLSQATQDADAKAQSALTKAGANANLLTTHQNTLDAINNTTIPNINSSISDAMAEASSAMTEAQKADTKIADYVTSKGLVSGTTVDTKINAATGEIKKKITTVEGKIPTEIGGRNLLQNTSDEWKTLSMSAGVWFKDFGYDENYKVEVGQTYTFSIIVDKVNDNDTVPINLHIGLGNTRGSYNYDFQSWRQDNIPMGEKVSLTYTITESDVAGGSRLWFAYRLRNEQKATYIRYKEAKLEKGSIPTDWSPAPEENLSQSEFQIFESTFNEDVKGINSTLTDLSTKKLDGTTYQNFYNNEYKQTAQGVTDAWTAVNKIIDANGNSTDAFAKAVYDKNATRQAADFKSVTDGLVKTTTYEEGIDGVKQSITSVSGRIDELSVGGRNYFKNSDVERTGSREFVNHYTWDMSPVINEFGTNTYYTVSFDIKSKVAGNINVYAQNGNGTKYSIGTKGVYASTTYKRFSYTFKPVLSSSTETMSMLAFFGSYDSGRIPTIKNVKFEVGNFATDWTPAPEDMLGKAEFTLFKNDYEETAESVERRLTAIDSSEEGSVVTRLNKTEKTASGNTTTISNIKTKPGEQITGYQTIKDRSDLYERVIGSSSEANVKNNMARIVMADSIFKTEVIDKTNVDDSNVFSSSTKVAALSNIGSIVRNDSLAPNGFRITGVSGNNGSFRLYDVITSNGWWTVSGWVRGSQNADIKFTIDICDSPDSKQFNTGTANEWQYFEFSHNVTNYTSTYSFVDFNGIAWAYYYFKDIKVEKNHHATAWTPSAIDFATQSHITQLADNINLKVSNKDLLSEINVQAGNVLIQSGTNKLNITPTTTSIQDATIKSAMIDTIDVKKITGIAADFTTMITKGLTADVITSTMIKADTALFDMLFSTTLATDRLAARTAWIKSANISTLDASKITSGTIAAARLDAGAIVTAGLTANVVKSAHIEAGTALVDKIFSTSAYITQLTSKAAFISSIQAINISASRITSGTLDASKATITNIDANNITANKTSFVQTAWNDINSEVAIDGSGIKTQNTNGDFSRIVSGELRSFNADSSSTAILGSGRSQYFDRNGSQFILGKTLHGTDWINEGTLQVTYNRKFAIGRYADYAGNNGNFHPYIALEYAVDKPGDEPNGIVRLYKAVYLQKGIYAGNNDISALSKISFYNGGLIESQSSTSNLLITASNKMVAYAAGTNAFEIDSGYMYLRRNLSMEGNNITNQSDRRLKTNIVDTPVDSLSAISNWGFKAFDRVNNGSHDDIGLIAQDTSEIVVYDEENDIYNVNSSKQIMMNSHGIQQLNIKVDDEISQLKAQVTNLQEELALLKGDRK
ncbi:hypothetical protein EF384_01090 [Aerococcus agrisoli]|uniref:Peptidase S74 domain-containing protein n=1 Tax=Aerococcus agrisoli TaxID=2487350 RepID=A0A3N4GWH3_9LACT|nr:hypothetical protein EF384_01090 [Aerococcus agrisoli]